MALQPEPEQGTWEKGLMMPVQWALYTGIRDLPKFKAQDTWRPNAAVIKAIIFWVKAWCFSPFVFPSLSLFCFFSLPFWNNSCLTLILTLCSSFNTHPRVHPYWDSNSSVPWIHHTLFSCGACPYVLLLPETLLLQVLAEVIHNCHFCRSNTVASQQYCKVVRFTLIFFLQLLP